MKSRWLQIIWKTQNTLKVWNNVWSIMIIKTRSFNKWNAHTLDHKCISWAKHSNLIFFSLSACSFYFFYFFIKCMQSMTMTLSKRCMYAKLHVIWSKSLLYIFSLINYIDSLCIQTLSLKLSQSYFRFSLFLRILRVLLFRF